MDANLISKVIKTLKDIRLLCGEWSNCCKDCKELFNRIQLNVEEIQCFNERFDDLKASNIERLDQYHLSSMELSLSRDLRKLRMKTNDLESIVKNVSKKRNDFMNFTKSYPNLDPREALDNRPPLATVLDLMASCQAILEKEVNLRKILMSEREEIENMKTSWLNDSHVFVLKERLDDLITDFE